MPQYKEVFGFDNPPLHDPCAVAYVIAPELFKVPMVVGFKSMWSIVLTSQSFKHMP